MTSVRLRAGAATDTGRVRSENQDSFAVATESDLFVVADGMGGARGGEVASRIAIDTITGAYDVPEPAVLAAAVESANEAIHRRASDDPELRGMGTTVTAAALMPVDEGDGDLDRIVIANVGDSRAYLFRAGGLTQLTEDHSMVADMVREGRLDPGEAERHPQRNILTRVLGVFDQVQVDMWMVDLCAGDRYVLCSDGLFNELSADRITAVLRRYRDDPDDAAGELVRQAVDAGGHDNVTVVVVDVVEDGDSALAAPSAISSRPVDLAGFTAAIPEGSAPPAAERPARSRRRRASDPDAPRTRLTWRVAAFVAALVAVLGGAALAVRWYATSSYFVGFDGDEVVIWQGRPDGVLWFDATIEQRTGIRRDELPGPALDRVEARREQADLGDARRFLANLQTDMARAERAASTTTSSSTTVGPPATVAPTTTAPP